MEEFDEGPEFVVQGYQFEPFININQTVESSSEDSIDENDIDDQSALVPCNTDWCSCYNCVIMDTARECRCYLGVPDVARKVHQEKLKCITVHESFKVNCLNHHVLQLSYILLSIS